MTTSVPRIIIHRIIGFIIFLILLAIANALIPAFNSSVYSEIINFFNTNLILLLILTLIGLINEIFWSFYFPFNIIAPITSSILSIFVIIFIHRSFDFLSIYFSQNQLILPWQAIQLAVFWIVFFAGYLIIFIRKGRPKEDWNKDIKKWHEARWERKRQKFKNKIDRKLGKKKVEWDDVGNEFKMLFYNLGKSFNDMFDRGKKKR